MSDYKSRMLKEYDQLNLKIEKLTTFIVSASFDALSEIDKADLKEQLTHMKAYANVLGKRCSRACT